MRKRKYPILLRVLFMTFILLPFKSISQDIKDIIIDYDNNFVFEYNEEDLVGLDSIEIDKYIMESCSDYYISDLEFSIDYDTVVYNDIINLNIGDIISGFNHYGTIQHCVIIKVGKFRIKMRNTSTLTYYSISKKKIMESVYKDCSTIKSYRILN